MYSVSVRNHGSAWCLQPVVLPLCFHSVMHCTVSAVELVHARLPAGQHPSCPVCYPRVTPTGLPDVLCLFLVSRADDVRFSCVATWYALDLA